MTNDINPILEKTIVGYGSDEDNQFYLEFEDGSELEFFVTEDGDLEIGFYSGFLDS